MTLKSVVFAIALTLFSTFTTTTNAGKTVTVSMSTTSSTQSQCLGSVYPINCTLQMAVSGGGSQQVTIYFQPGYSTYIYFAGYNSYATITNYSANIPAGAYYPDIITVTFQGVGNISGDGNQDDPYVGTATFNLIYTQGTGRGVYLATVTSSTLSYSWDPKAK
jgi:hypothetical protein